MGHRLPLAVALSVSDSESAQACGGIPLYYAEMDMGSNLRSHVAAPCGQAQLPPLRLS